MILYFIDRLWNILGQASTSLPEGIETFEDLKVEDVESGIASFECEIPFTFENRADVERFTEVGNYILRKHDGKDEFFTIIESEKETKGRYVYLYAEDAGLDLINEVYGAYEADQAYPIAHYVNKYVNDSGFVIGVNEISSRTRTLSWDGEATATERLASVANGFDCEISFSFEIEGLKLLNKYVNIHAKRGKNEGVQLRLNKEIDNIITKKSIANLATALLCTGGTPEDENTEDDVEPVPITLAGYVYDDGEFYVDGKHLKSRTALKKWSRYLWQDEPNKQQGYEGHIVKLFSYDTLSQQELCAHAVTELKKICDMEVNYEVDIAKLPEGVQVGDTVCIVDDAGELYVETRILKLEESVANQTHKATLGDFLIKESGISQKVADLAIQFATEAKANAKARKAAEEAKKLAEQVGVIKIGGRNLIRNSLNLLFDKYTFGVTELKIVSHPSDYTGAVGDVAVFKVVAEGDGLTYQWQYKNSGQANWYNSGFDGNKTDTQPVTITTHRNLQEYRCVVSDQYGNSTISNSATLTVV